MTIRSLEECQEADVTPGLQVADYFFATPGSVAECVLRAIVEEPGSSRYPRTLLEFEESSHSDSWSAVVQVGIPDHGENRVVRLFVGDEKPELSGVVEVADTMSGVKGVASLCLTVVRVNKCRPLSDSGRSHLANQLVAAYVCHGKNWQNRVRDCFPLPQGQPAANGSKTRKKKINRFWRIQRNLRRVFLNA